jgi:hypothetical protein
LNTNNTQTPQEVPELFKALPCVTWKKSPDGKKIPTPSINSETPLTYEQVKDTPCSASGGWGIVFKEDNDLGGIDLDACLNPETGELTKWAKAFVDTFDSYTEISPSGTGVKIYATGAPPNISPNVLVMPGPTINGKTPQVEAYVKNRYFAITGKSYHQPARGIRSTPAEWLKLVTFLQQHQPQQTKTSTSGPEGNRNNTLTQLAGAMRRKGMDYDSILIAIRSENAKRYSPPLPENELITICKSVCRYNPAADGYERDQHQNIKPNSQGNVLLGLQHLKYSFRHNIFADRFLVSQDGKNERLMDDGEITRIWLDIDSTLHFRPSYEFFQKVLMNETRSHAFHPVREYLESLKWDGVERLNNWLTVYAGAVQNEYTQAIGELTLVAAVRRIKQPGCKFDEMLILESKQGTGKSTLLKILAVEPAWFTDNLPLTSESKEVIELTNGKWIIEAAELSGMRKSDVETLKSFLSRQVEIARLAYDRLTTERPRHFIVIGTTNSKFYLKDTTDNRRSWPVEVNVFNLEKLKQDRDQLWAEAVHYETTKEEYKTEIRLNPKLWHLAAIEQDSRQAQEPWLEIFEETFGTLNGKLHSSEVWKVVDIPIARRTQLENAKIGEVMKKIGFERKKAKMENKTTWTYQRGTPEERQYNTIEVIFDPEMGKPIATLKIG